MAKRRNHRGQQSASLPPPSGDGTPDGWPAGARDHRGETPPVTGPRPDLSEAGGGVQVTDTPSTPDLGKGAGGD
jgi:hypothetical protein